MKLCLIQVRWDAGAVQQYDYIMGWVLPSVHTLHCCRVMHPVFSPV